jgi:hypothetical protein
MLRKYLLPANLDDAGRRHALLEMVSKHSRGTTGWIHDVYPNERGWVSQAGSPSN